MAWSWAVRILSAVGSALFAVQSASVGAETVERCQFPPLTQLGKLAPQDGVVRFVKIDGGIITGSVAPIEVQITGCSDSARYRMYFPAPIRVSNGEWQLELWPVVSGVNGVRRSPVAIVGSENAIDLEGNPRLQVMFALSRSDWGRPIPTGNWAASFPVNFEDR